MPENIYKASSTSQLLFSVILQLGCIAIIVYLYSHYNENPNVIFVAIAICVLIFLFSGYEEISVDSDMVTQKKISLGTWLLRSKGMQYEMSEIKTAFIPAPVKSDASEIGIAMILFALFPKHGTHRTSRNYPICLSLKSGHLLQIMTRLSESKRIEIVDAINSIK
ncbi:MAG: hypothetical protein ABI402_01885 [Ferruginibacter sp.]